MIKARLAVLNDLEFAGRDGRLPLELVKRKIRWQEVIVAERKSKLVGCLHLDYLWSRVPYVSCLDVPLAEYPRDVTRTLFDFTEGFLWNRGYETLLSSSRIGDAPSSAWHQQLGFVPCGLLAMVQSPSSCPDASRKMVTVPSRKMVTVPTPGETFYRRQLGPDGSRYEPSSPNSVASIRTPARRIQLVDELVASSL